jgi:hypothetical protein
MVMQVLEAGTAEVDAAKTSGAPVTIEPEVEGPGGAAAGKALFIPVEGPPSNLLLGTVGDRRLRVAREFRVRITSEGGDFVAEAEEVNEFGFGPTRAAALRDLERAIVQLYFSLAQDEGRLGRELEQTLTTLREKLILRVS